MQSKKSHRDEEDLGGEECSKDGENLSQVEFLSQSSYCETICYSHQQVRSKLIIFSTWNNEKLRKNKEPPTEIWKKFPKVTKWSIFVFNELFYDSEISFQPVAGVIGASFSGVSIMVANILKLFRVSHPFFTFSISPPPPFHKKNPLRLFRVSHFSHFLSLFQSLHFTLFKKKLLKLFRLSRLFSYFVSSPLHFMYKYNPNPAWQKNQWSTFLDSTDQLCLHLSGALWQVQVGIYDLDRLERWYFIALFDE